MNNENKNPARNPARPKPANREYTLKIIRPSIFALAGEFLRLAILLGVVLAIKYFFPVFLYKNWLLIGLATLVILYFILRLFSFFANRLVITNRRLIDVERFGLFRQPQVTEVYWEEVTAVGYFKKTILEKIMGVGTLVIDLKEGDKIAFFNVFAPSGKATKLKATRQYYVSGS